MSYLSAEKAETELAQSIKKACSIEESAPKQKHVRSKLLVKQKQKCVHLGKTHLFSAFLECIVYTWDHRTSAIIWNILKVQPLLSDEVQAFKALILVHKIVKDGHPNVCMTK